MIHSQLWERNSILKKFQSLTHPQKHPGLGTGIISHPQSSSGILVLPHSGLLWHTSLLWMVPPYFLAVMASVCDNLDLTRWFTAPVWGEGSALSWTLSYSIWKCPTWIKAEMCWEPKRCWGKSDPGVYFNSRKTITENHIFSFPWLFCWGYELPGGDEIPPHVSV